MNIPEQFKEQFKNEIKGKSEDEIIAILEKYSAIDFSGMERFLVKKEFERLIEKRGGLCESCTYKMPRGVIDELGDMFNKGRRQVYRMVKS